MPSRSLLFIPKSNTMTHYEDDSKPSLPPQMESIRSHTADELIQMMKRTPLFMTSIEDAEGDGTQWMERRRVEERVNLNVQVRRRKHRVGSDSSPAVRRISGGGRTRLQREGKRDGQSEDVEGW